MPNRLGMRLLAAALLLGVAFPTGAARAQTAPQPAPAAAQAQDYRDAPFVHVSLGELNQEAGVRLVDGLPDGLTEPMVSDSGRKSVPNPVSPDRHFYFDVHDTYVKGGRNSVVVTLYYRDRGLTPFYLEYDAYDPDRPDSQVDAVTKKRVPVANRANTDDWVSASITLADARFGNNQPGGADFRLVSSDELILSNVSVLLVAHEEPKPPIRVLVDGKPVIFDVVPYITEKNLTIVPMRAMFNALGVSDKQIVWEGASRTVTAQRGQTTIALTIDSDVAYVNYFPKKLDQPAVIRADRTMVPLRFISEEFGLKVSWDGANRVITITSPAQSQP